MKILKFTDTYLPTINGASYSINLWKNRLEERGISVELICPMKTGDISIRSIPFPFYDGYRIGIPEKISDKIEEPDLIHIHTPFSVGSLGAYLSKKKDIPRIFTHHTDPEDYINYLTESKSITNPLLNIYDSWEKKILNNSDIVTVPSEKIKKDMQRSGIENVKVVSNGLNSNFFQPSEPIFREKDNSVLLGYSGRHGKEKRLEDLIRVSDRFENFKILIAGDGPARSYYQDLAKEKKNVEFLGFLNREKLPNFYSSLDVFVFPSIVETQGLVGLEANACGTPVVGANRKALKVTVKEGMSGYRYEPGNIDDLEKKIKKTLNNKKKLEKSSRTHAKNHSAEKSIDKIINLYKKLASE